MKFSKKLMIIVLAMIIGFSITNCKEPDDGGGGGEEVAVLQV
ncbi:hypothetical protein [Treponema sp. R6D11]